MEGCKHIHQLGIILASLMHISEYSGVVASILRMTIFFREEILGDPTCTDIFYISTYWQLGMTNPVSYRGLRQSRHMVCPRIRHYNNRCLPPPSMAVAGTDTSPKTHEEAGCIQAVRAIGRSTGRYSTEAHEQWVFAIGRERRQPRQIGLHRHG